ncbi:MAG: hypothetical protein CVU06_12230, partial [Bacteroidetes bacterium HGW-Bacteroidetes-22]
PTSDLGSIRFGVLLSSEMAEAWQVECIRHLVNRGAVVALIILDATPAEAVPLSQRLRHYDWSRLLFNLFYRYKFKPKTKKLLSVETVMQGARVMHCRPITKGVGNFFSSGDVEAIRDADLHFLLRFGFGILRGEVLDAPRHGVWSFHHGDEQFYRGSPPGLWEIYKGDPVTGVILQRITDRLDDGEVLYKGWFRTINRSWSDHLDQLQWGSVDWPARCAAALKNGVLNPVAALSRAPVFKPPRNFAFICLLLKMMINRLRFHLGELFRAEDWNIAIAPSGNSLRPCINSIWQWFPKPEKNVFVADPFIVTVRGVDYVWFEEYNCRKERGRISAVRVAEVDRYPQSRSVLLEEPWHLSFPSVTEHEGELFCTPESFAARQIRLYRLQLPDMKLVLDTVLIDNLPGVDPVLWFERSRWWLFCTTKDAPSIHLYLFFADDLRGPYYPHPLNPVKSDLRSSRPAGNLFMLNGKLYRPAQDCSVHYGRKVVINEVEVLSTIDYREKSIEQILPVDKNRFYEGIHTYNFNTSNKVVDGKRFVFILAVFKLKFTEHFKRFFQHV